MINKTHGRINIILAQQKSMNYLVFTPFRYCILNLETVMSDINLVYSNLFAQCPDARSSPIGPRGEDRETLQSLEKLCKSVSNDQLPSEEARFYVAQWQQHCRSNVVTAKETKFDPAFDWIARFNEYPYYTYALIYYHIINDSTLRMHLARKIRDSNLRMRLAGIKTRINRNVQLNNYPVLIVCAFIVLVIIFVRVL
jgi:hypothetical protein